MKRFTTNQVFAQLQALRQYIRLLECCQQDNCYLNYEQLEYYMVACMLERQLKAYENSPAIGYIELTFTQAQKDVLASAMCELTSILECLPN